MNHTEILNHLAKKYDYKTYLEIGVQNPTLNFNKINCIDRQGVDPEPDPHQIDIYLGTSDEFFDCPCSNDMFFDLIFIDGLHHADQVKKDFENSLKRLNPGGRIMLHDCNPHKEEITKVPRETKEWTGDVYKFAATMKSFGLEYFTVDSDYGCMIVTDKKVEPVYTTPVEWMEFTNNKNELLNLITVNDFIHR